MKRTGIALSTAAYALGLIIVDGVDAQEVSVPAVTTASPGGYANPLKLDTDRHDRDQRAKAKRRAGTAPPAGTTCSADALPATERRRMETEYVRRAKADGKASADAWVREQGKRFRVKLVEQGICPGPSGNRRTATRDKPDAGKKGCGTVLRPVAGLGGDAMTLTMVPDC